MTDPNLYASMWSHVSELRSTLLRILFVILFGIVLSFVCYEPIITYLVKPAANRKTSPLQEQPLEYVSIRNGDTFAVPYTLPPTHRLLEKSPRIKQLADHSWLIHPGEEITVVRPGRKWDHLLILGPLEGTFIALRVSAWIGCFATSPLWLWILMQFFLPGMNPSEKRLILPFLCTSLVFMGLGCLLAFYVTIPIANEYLFSFNQNIGMNLWSLSQYLDYTLFLLLANGLAFELGVIGVFSVHFGILTAETLIRHRRGAIVAAFIVGALLTPPDVLTQVMLAIPLIILYEGMILYGKIRNRYSLLRT